MNIDRIAREMVDVEPSVDLEARIRERIRAAGPAPARTTAWWVWRVATPLGAMAAVAVAVVQGPAVTSQVVSSPGPQVVSSAGPQVATSSGPQGAASPVARVRTSTLPEVPASLLTSEEIAWMERRMPALDPVNALQMDRLRMDSIQPEPLAITPLTMTPVGTDGAGIERRNDR